MGEVYEAFDERLQRRVALKSIRADQRLDAAARNRFLHEARTLSLLDNPLICRIYDYVEGEDSDLLVLEFISGRTLRDLAHDLDFDRKLVIAQSIARALAAAHRAGIVHRDLKPENVMLTESGDVKVLDFGLASSASSFAVATVTSSDPDSEATAVRPQLTTSPSGSATLDLRSNKIAGTPMFMSPEQARGETITPASDLYSFGLLLQTLFSGKRPYLADLPARTVMEMAARGESLPPVGIDRDVTSLIQKLKHFAPSDRPTAIDALARLEWIANRKARLLRRVAAVVVIALLTAGGAKYVVDVRRERSIAEHRRAQAERLVAFMVGDLRKKLEPVGRLDVLSGVGGEAMRYFSDLTPAEMTTDELRENARTLSQIGEVQSSLGNPAAAAAAMQRSLALATEAVKREPGNADARFEVATSEFWIGDLSRLRGDLPGALAHYEIYMHACEALAKENPANKLYAIESGYGHSNVGTILEQQGNLAAALDHYQRAVAIKERNSDDKGDIANTVNKVAVVLNSMGRYAEARAAFAREHDLLAAALKTRPDNTKWLTALATNRNALASLEEDNGDDARALALIAEQHEITAGLVARDPKNTQWQRNLATSDSVWSRVLRLRGDFAESETHSRVALEQLTPLLVKDPTRAQWKRDAIFMHCGLAWLALVRRDPAAAGEIAQARALMQTLSGSDPATQRTRWEFSLAAGAVAEGTGDVDNARREWTSVADALWPSRDHLDNRKRALLARALIYLGRISDAQPIVNQLTNAGYRNRELVSLWTEKRRSSV